MCIATPGAVQPEASHRLSASDAAWHGGRLPFRLPQLAKLADYTANLVVRGGIEPPAFRFSAGFPGPGWPMTGCLTRPYAALAFPRRPGSTLRFHCYC